MVSGEWSVLTIGVLRAICGMPREDEKKNDAIEDEISDWTLSFIREENTTIYLTKER